MSADYYATAGIFIVCDKPKQKTLTINTGEENYCATCENSERDHSRKYCGKCGGKLEMVEGSEEVDFSLNVILGEELEQHPLYNSILVGELIHMDDYFGGDEYILLKGNTIDVCGDPIATLPFITENDVNNARVKHEAVINTLKEYFKSVTVKYMIIGQIL